MKRKIIMASITAMLSYSLHAEVYAVVNGEKVTDEDVKPMLQMFMDAKSVDDLNKHEKEMLLDQSIERILIIQEAKKEKLDNDKKFQQIVDDFKKRLLVEFWMKKRLNTIQVSDTEIKEYFEKNRADYPKKTELKNVKDEIREKVKMQKFQILVDEKLSNMKKEAKIEYR
jgi:peptidylprolyl isomerase